VVDQHHGVIHLVDVVAGENHDKFGFWPIGFQDIDVLVDSVSRASIPRFLIYPLLRRQQVNELIDFTMQEVPAALQVAQETVGLVLGHHANAPKLRVDAVRQGKIDNPELATEMDRGLCPPVGQLVQPATAPASQNQGNCPARQLKCLLVNHLRIP
jgi:hypothetical protein